MPFFKDAEEVYEYLGGMFLAARETEAGPRMAAADIEILKLVPLCKPLFPVYREKIAEKDAAVA